MRRFAMTGLVGMFLLSCTGWTQGMRIPVVHGATFAGESIALPEALKGKVGVLIVGFSEASRTEAADWGQKLADDPQRPAELSYYEMPVLESVPRLLRGLVLRKIKQSISQKGQTHFLPVLDHEAEWKEVTGFGKAEDAYLLVVDANGIVRWRTEGALTDAAYREVKRRAAEAKR